MNTKSAYDLTGGGLSSLRDKIINRKTKKKPRRKHASAYQPSQPPDWVYKI